MQFVLHPKLEADSQLICCLPLCQVRLHHNAAFPWLLLIPQRNNMVEIIDLAETEQLQLLKEIRQSSIIMKKRFNAKKLNIANLGNIVSQLHIHVIARFENDAAWPGPVWGTLETNYSPNEIQTLIAQLKRDFQE